MARKPTSNLTSTATTDRCSSSSRLPTIRTRRKSNHDTKCSNNLESSSLNNKPPTSARKKKSKLDSKNLHATTTSSITSKSSQNSKNKKSEMFGTIINNEKDKSKMILNEEDKQESAKRLCSNHYSTTSELISKLNPKGENLNSSQENCNIINASPVSAKQIRHSQEITTTQDDSKIRNKEIQPSNSTLSQNEISEKSEGAAILDEEPVNMTLLVSALRSNYMALADNTIDSIDNDDEDDFAQDADGVEILVKPIKLLLGQQQHKPNVVIKEQEQNEPSDQKSQQQNLVRNINYKELMNELKTDLENCSLPNATQSNRQDDQTNECDSFKENNSVLQDNLSPELSTLIDDVDEDFDEKLNKLKQSKTTAIAATTPEKTPYLSSKFQSQSNKIYPIQSTPLPPEHRRAKRSLEFEKYSVTSRTLITPSSDGYSLANFFLDDENDDDYDELISNIAHATTHRIDDGSPTKIAKFSYQQSASNNNRIQVTIRLPRQSLLFTTRPHFDHGQLLSLEQISSKLDWSKKGPSNQSHLFIAQKS